MSEQIFDKADNYLTHIWEELQENLDDAAEGSDGLPCPGCVANDFVEQNKTMIMSEIYSISKQNPLEVMALLTRALLFHKAMQNSVMELMEINEDFFSDQCFLESDNDD